MFERIQKELEPQTVAVGKYDAAFTGKPDKILATIEEGQEFQKLFLSKIGYRKAPGAIVSTGLLAVLGRNGGTYVKVEDMLADKFPTNKPIDLYFEVEQGSDRDTSDDFGGEEINPAATKGQYMARVRDLIEKVLKNPHDDAGLLNIFAEVSAAAIAAFTPPTPAAPETQPAPAPQPPAES